jgi:hypothetical protein
MCVDIVYHKIVFTFPSDCGVFEIFRDIDLQPTALGRVADEVAVACRRDTLYNLRQGTLPRYT